MDNAITATPLVTLLELTRRTRLATSADELGFLAVNDTHALAPYRQAVLWVAGGGVRALSGVVNIERNAPYVDWLDSLCRPLGASLPEPARVDPGTLSADVAEAWGQWLPAHALWLPLADQGGGLLLARDLPWTDAELALLASWCEAWDYAWRQLHRQPGWRLSSWRQWFRRDPEAPWWRQARLRWAAALVLLPLLPVRLTVLAPGELVPAHPAVIRAPLDGVLASFAVQPNEAVKAGQPLFDFDEVLLRGRADVTRQALATAETEYRQSLQQALADERSRAQLAVLSGKVEEKRAEAAYVADQLQRARVVAPRDGIALFDDPSEWIGKPVTIGERVMRIADPGDVEIEAWLPMADAIPLGSAAPVRLYLNATPLSPVAGTLRYLAHDAVQRPDGSYAYRVRARLDAATEHRVGLKGTAKLQGSWVPLGYWVLRRPLAALRGLLGW